MTLVHPAGRSYVDPGWTTKVFAILMDYLVYIQFFQVQAHIGKELKLVLTSGRNSLPVISVTRVLISRRNADMEGSVINRGDRAQSAASPRQCWEVALPPTSLLSNGFKHRISSSKFQKHLLT
ncbi:MAG: hypothetical protein PVH36_11775, partial [Desulfobacterales bacterium]